MHSVLYSGIVSFAYLRVALSGPLIARETFTPGANCTSEGTYKCASATSFQQCRWGHWSDIVQVEPNTKCDFHEEVGWKASSLTYNDVHGAGKTVTEPVDPSKVQSDSHLQRRAVNSLVPDPSVRDEACKSNVVRRDEEYSPEDHDQQLTKRALPIPQIVFCGETQEQAKIYFSTDVRRAVNYGSKLDRHQIYNYPKLFNNNENLDMHGCQPPLYEYPLWSGYTFGSQPVAGDRKQRELPSGERVIFDRCGNLCAITWHPFPAPNNAVDDCIYGS